MIPYDQDIDVGICEEDIEEFKKNIPFLTNNGEVFKQISNSQFIYSLSNINNIHIDIFVYKKFDNIYKSPDSSIVNSDLFPFEKKMFEGMEFNVPNNSIKYIESVYGNDCINIYLTTQHPNNLDLPSNNVWENYIKN